MQGETRNAEIIRLVLEKQWPDACAVAGKSTVRNVARSVSDHPNAEWRRAPGIASADHQAIQHLLSAALLVKLCIESAQLKLELADAHSPPQPTIPISAVEEQAKSLGIAATVIAMTTTVIELVTSMLS